MRSLLSFLLMLTILVSCDRSRSVSIVATCDDVAVTAQTNARAITGDDGDVDVTVQRIERVVVPILLPMPFGYERKPVLAEKPQ